jgi:uncharacterized membrane protein
MRILLFLKTRQKVLKVVYALIWFFFLPNTLYLITDLLHIFWQWHRMHPVGQMVLALQYITLVLIGLMTFILALYAVEKSLLSSSWDMLVDIPKVVTASINIFSSPELILLGLFFALFANVYYFLCRKSPRVS